MASDDFREAIHTLLQDLGALQDRVRSVNERLDVKRQGLRETYRRDLDLMTSDKVLAHRYLGDRDPSLRLLALEVLADHWTPDEAYFEHCERLAAEDPVGTVRSRALRRLGEQYAGTSNSRLMTLAARLARDERNTESFAYGAYKVFCLIAGIKMGRPKQLSDIKLLYVDWGVLKPYY
jgi:hypothetical protein